MSTRKTIPTLLLVLLVGLLAISVPVVSGEERITVQVLVEPFEEVAWQSVDGQVTWYQVEANDYGDVRLPNVRLGEHRFTALGSGLSVVRNLKEDRSAVCLRESGCVLETWLPPRPEGPRPGGAGDSEVLVPNPPPPAKGRLDHRVRPRLCIHCVCVGGECDCVEMILSDDKECPESECEFDIGCAEPCTPDCAGKVCGPDGCGGYCGVCGVGEPCVDGQCVCSEACTSAGFDSGFCAFCDVDADPLCDPCPAINNTLVRGDFGCWSPLANLGEGPVGCCCEGGCGWICASDASGLTLCLDDCPLEDMPVCNSPATYPFCIELPCTPDCAGKECGDDGCGGYCPPGCGAGEPCVDGRCVCSEECTSRGFDSGTCAVCDMDADPMCNPCGSDTLVRGDFGCIFPLTVLGWGSVGCCCAK